MNEILFRIGELPVHTGEALIGFGALALTLLLVVVIVVVVAIVVALRAIRGDRRPPLSEDDPVPSKRFAPSGLISTAAEKDLQRQWDGTPNKHVAPKSAAPS